MHCAHLVSYSEELYALALCCRVIVELSLIPFLLFSTVSQDIIKLVTVMTQLLRTDVENVIITHLQL